MSGPSLAAGGDEAVLAAIGLLTMRREVPAWLVGGAVRDRLLLRPVVDVDVALECGGRTVVALAERLAAEPGWRLCASHPRFGTATLRAPDGSRVDLAGARREIYPAPAALPVVTGPATIEEDLSRRDFTIHAMAVQLGERGPFGALLDPFGGRSDLQTGTLRLLSERSLVDDPTRAFRAVKYAARFGFHPEKAFARRLLLAREAGAFQKLTPDRFRRGFEEALAEPDRGVALQLLRRHRLLDDVLPGWSGATIPEADLLAADAPEARWAALLAPLSPEERRKVGSRLAFPRALRRASGVPLR